MTVRALILLLATATLAAVAVAPALARPAAKPSAAAMVLTGNDFPEAVVSYQGKKLAPTVVPVVSDVPIADKYSRTFKNARVGTLPVAAIFSSALVSTSEAKLGTLMGVLSGAIAPGPARRAFVGALNGGLGQGERITLIRARTLHLGDSAVELILHLELPGARFDIDELWIRQGSAVSSVATYTTSRPLTPGESFALAKTLNGHLQRAVAPK